MPLHAVTCRYMRRSQAERDLLERKVNELRREMHTKNKEIEHLEAELKLSKSQQAWPRTQSH